MADVNVIDETMGSDLQHNWGWIALRGVAAVILGVLALWLPGVTLTALVLVWGAYALVDGALAMVSAFRIRDRGKPFLALLAIGFVGLLAGVATFLWPGMTALVLLSFIAAWSLIVGILQVTAAIRLRKSIEHEWLLAASGALSVAFGALMLVSPGAGALAVLWLIGVYAIAFGVLMITLGLSVRSATNQPRLASQTR